MTISFIKNKWKGGKEEWIRNTPPTMKYHYKSSSTLLSCLLLSSVVWTTLLCLVQSVETKVSWIPKANANYDTILVVYSGPSSMHHHLAHTNFNYFISHGGVNCSNHDTAIVLTPQVYEYYQSKLQVMDDECLWQGHRVFAVVNKDNSHDVSMVLRTIDVSLYRSMIVTHATLSGPFQPYWTHAFTSKLCCGVILIGLSGVCDDTGPYIQTAMGYAIMVQDALPLLKEVIHVDCSNYDVALSAKILKGYGLHSIIQNTTIWRFNQELCTMHNIWTSEGWIEHFGHHLPSLGDSVFFKTSWRLPKVIANEIGFFHEEEHDSEYWYEL